jgi:hypothetical protein
VAAVAAVAGAPGVRVAGGGSVGQHQAVVPPGAPRGGTRVAFEFGLIGGLPCSASDLDRWRALVADINRHDIAFVAHDVDFKDDPRGTNPGRQVCSDELYRQLRAERFRQRREAARLREAA